MCFFFFPALHARIWFPSTSSRLFAVTQKVFFYLAVINIPLGFCLKLHPTDKSRRKSLNLWVKCWYFFLLNTTPYTPPPPDPHTHTPLHTHTPKKTSQSNWSWRTNFWFTFIQLDNLTNNLDSKSPKKLLSCRAFSLLRSRLHAHTSTFPSPRYSKSSRLSDGPQVSRRSSHAAQDQRTRRVDGQQMHQITSFAMETKQRLCRAVFYLMDITHCLRARPEE